MHIVTTAMEWYCPPTLPESHVDSFRNAAFIESLPIIEEALQRWGCPLVIHTPVRNPPKFTGPLTLTWVDLFCCLLSVPYLGKWMFVYISQGKSTQDKCCLSLLPTEHNNPSHSASYWCYVLQDSFFKFQVWLHFKHKT